VGGALMHSVPAGTSIAVPEALPARPMPFMRLVLSGRLGVLYALNLFLACVSQQLDALVPVGIKHAVNAADALNRQSGTSHQLFVSFALLCSIFCGAVLVSRAYQLSDSYFSPSLRHRVQEIFTSFMIRQQPAWFDIRPSGSLAQHAGSLPGAVMGVLDILCVDVARFLVLITSTTVIVALHNRTLAACIALWAVVYLSYSATAARGAKTLAAAAARASSHTASELMDLISNMWTVFSFSGAGHERKRIAQFFDAEYVIATDLRRYIVKVRFVQSMLAITCIIAINAFAAWRFVGGTLSVGDVSLMFGISTYLCMGIWQASSRLPVLFEQSGRIAEILSVISESSEVRREGKRRIQACRGEIAFSDVSFRYASGVAVLRNLNLTIRAGERVGITGRSGAGKSTLLRLLRRHFALSAGRILIDNVDISELDSDMLASLIAEVTQTPKLFNRSVEDNVAYGRRDASLDQIADACRSAECHDSIVQRPQAYEFIAGEDGRNLSAGERQRIVIARALLSNAPILVLDEPTSALDAISAAQVERTLLAVMPRRTMLIVSHSPAILEKMDRIAVLEQGQIVEGGDYREFIDRIAYGAGQTLS
jgi:ATP-binding cassette subfamily B protein